MKVTTIRSIETDKGELVTEQNKECFVAFIAALGVPSLDAHSPVFGGGIAGGGNHLKKLTEDYGVDLDEITEVVHINTLLDILYRYNPKGVKEYILNFTKEQKSDPLQDVKM